MSDPSRYTISQVARTARVISQARAYRVMELVRPCAVTAAGYQFFDDIGVERVCFIAVATRAGLPLVDLAKLLSSLDQGHSEEFQEACLQLHQRLKERRRSLTHFRRLLNRICTNAGMQSGPGITP
ncbi:transcriptional regulator merD [mine drainage metagenome]|uniref:Transcriptional regulator merD n=2 Tax=mine drainage metagenome TaxID=410659 RepID=T0ZAU0_9ZZZZ